MALRGYVLSRMKLSPYDPRFVTLSQNDDMLSFVAYWLNEAEESGIDKLGSMLGTEWTREQAESLNKKPGPQEAAKNSQRERLSLPLVLGINPEVTNMITSAFAVTKEGSKVAAGDYKPEENEEIVELDERFSKDAFLRFAKQAPVISDDKEKRKVVTDPKKVPATVKKMHEQVQQAKRASRRDRG